MTNPRAGAWVCRTRQNAQPSSYPNSSLKTVIFVHFRGDQKVTKTATQPAELLWSLRNSFSESGRGGIRTHGPIARSPDFESGTFDHSATLPSDRVGEDNERG